MTKDGILGVDPGMGGALAFLGKDALDLDWIDVFDMPTFGEGKQRAVDGASVAVLIQAHKPRIAFVEKVNAMKGWGSGSVFRFGDSFGVIRGVLGALNIPLRLVTPQKWKKAMGLPSDKEASRRMIIERYPAFGSLFARKLDHNRAESALLAVYGAEVLAAS